MQTIRTLLRRRVLTSLGALALLAALAGCGDSSGPAFTGSDITGTHMGQGWTLTGTNGKPYTLQSFAGKVTLFFFGYTQCPDVCPTTLAELAQVVHLLGDQASRVQIVMITVDPERDTPEVLGAYVSSFDPSFLGLTGTPEQVKVAAGAFKAYYAKVAQANGGYSMDHSASFYLFDTQGEARVLLNNSASAAVVAHDIEALLH